MAFLKVTYILIASNLVNYLLISADKEYSQHSHHDHIDKHYLGGIHNSEYDKNAILGSLDAGDDYSKMSISQAKQKFTKHFKKIDLNGDGYVDKNEISAFVFDYFLKADEKEAQEKLVDSDANQDGNIDWEEYLKQVYGYEFSEIEEFKKDTSIEMSQFLKDDRSRFEAADENKDDKLNASEYGAFLHPSNYKYMHDYELNLSLQQIDRDGDGFITFDEYLGDSTPGYEQRLVDHENFLSYDLNNDGKLDREEVRVWLLPNKRSMADEEAEHLIQETDSNGDGKLSLQEIVDKYDIWVGSAATHYGDGLKHDPSEL